VTWFKVTHQQSVGQAFLNVERALAESYNDFPRVLKLRQPETGTLILRPLVPYQVGGPIGPIEHCRYSLKITVATNSFLLEFKLEPEGYWPPSAEIPKIQKQFRNISEAVAKSVDGEIRYNL